MGHRDILYFGRRKRSSTHQLRAEGYSDACIQFGLTPHFFNSPYSSSSIQHGYTLAKQLFATKPSHTAIFAATDSLALGVLQAADEAGIRIPEEISLLASIIFIIRLAQNLTLPPSSSRKMTMASIALKCLGENKESVHRLFPSDFDPYVD
jgi:LacI family transcriptional regulator